MKDVFQIIGVILAIIIAVVGYIFAILRFKSSKRERCDEAWFFEGLTASSAFAICILLIFVGISLLF